MNNRSAIVLISIVFCSCSFQDIQKGQEHMSAELGKTVSHTVETTTNTVKKVERKIQQGKEVLDAVHTTKEKLDAFQNDN